MLKKLSFLLTIIITIIFSVPVLSSSVSSNDGNIVFAVHPYFSKEDKENFNLKNKRNKRLVPIGLLIQNYGSEPVDIGKINVVSSSDEIYKIPQFTPFGKRPVGAIADEEFFKDGDILNYEMRNQYASARTVPKIGKNEIFYLRTLKPGNSFYGIVYLEKRKKNARPSKIKSLDGLTLKIQFRKRGQTEAYSAMLPLDEQGGSRVEMFVAEADDRQPLKCPSEGCKNLGAGKMAGVEDAFYLCYMKSLAKNGKIDGAYWGKKANAWVFFDSSGNYLFHEIFFRSSDKSVNKAADEVAIGMDYCKLPYSPEAEAVSYGEPFFAYPIKVGDVMLSESEKRKHERKYQNLSDAELAAHNMQLLNYRKNVTRKIRANWILPIFDKERSARVTVFIDQEGDIKKADLTKKSGDKEFDAAAMDAVQKSAPFPTPPELLKEEAYKEGFLIVFNSPRGL